MNTASLLTRLSAYALFSPVESEAVLRACRAVNLNTDEFLWHGGQVCERVSFLAAGVMRVVTETPDGDETTMYFLAENEFVVDLESYQQHRPSPVGVQALMPCEVLVIERSNFEELTRTCLPFRQAVQQVTEQALLQKVDRRSPLVGLDATARYEAFLRQYPGLANRVPLHHVASYLGIAPQSLSRIRRQLARAGEALR